MDNETCEQCDNEILGQMFYINNKKCCLLCKFKHTSIIIENVFKFSESECC